MDELDSLIRRVEHLEQQNRRHRWGGSIVALLLAAAVLVGATSTPTELDVTKLHVLDAKGKGKGQIIPAAKVTFTKSNTIAIENFGAQPALLMGLTRRK